MKLNFILVNCFLLFCIFIDFGYTVKANSYKFKLNTKSDVTCSEQSYCLLVNLTTLLQNCRDFFKVPCPCSCGEYSSLEFKLKFAKAIDPNGNGQIATEKAQGPLKLLNITLEDALVTEINDLLLDIKALATDTYKLFDIDNSGVVTLTEAINGLLNFIESMQVEIKPEFKESVQYISEIIRVSNQYETVFPKLSEFVQQVLERVGAYPHGLITFNRLQNFTDSFLNLERLLITEQSKYLINTKLLSVSFLSKIDENNDGFVSQSEYIHSILNFIKQFNTSISSKADENLKAYFDIYSSSVKSLLNKYGLADFNLLEGKILPEIKNKPFTYLVIPIHEATQHLKVYSTNAIMRYIKSATNKMPKRKLTLLSIIESSFIIADRNKDGLIDIPEFVYFTINNLPRDVALNDMNESLKIIKLFDENNDDKLSTREFKELMKPVLESSDTIKYY